MKRFLIIFEVLLFSLAMRAQSVTYTCRYWFDQNDVQTTTFSSSIWQAELDIGSLADGLHTLHIHVMDTSMKWSAPQNYLFLKTTYTQQENCVYHCWFDEDFANKQTDSLGNGSFLMDVSGIEEGLHTLNVILQGSSLTATQSYLFMRVEMLEVNGVDMSNLTYHCWFDEDFEHQQTDSLRDGNFLLDVTNLSNGLHSVSVMLEGGMGTLTPRKCYFFYKIPFGGNGLNKWEYCVNGDWANRITTNIVPSVDTLSIVSLLPVPTQTIRSSCFHFHPNGDEPYLNAKNEITLRFWTADDHFIDKSAFYIDEYVSEPIQTDDLEYNATANIPAPRDNQMQWYKVPLVVGDSIAFKTDKACTVQLFAPSGEEVYAATASEALVFGGIHAWEDGDYYLVVHDVTGSGDEICLTNVYIHKFAILAYDVHLVGNGGCSTITFQGNGFNSLLDVYLLNAQNDTIHRLDIGHESNTTTTVTFDFYQANLGVYDAVFQYYGETIRVNGALEVQEPVDIVLTSSVSYPSRFLRNTPCTYTYTITNNGNMSAYGVPIYLYISTPTENGISRLEFDGLNLPTLLDYFDLDSLSQNEIEELRQLSDELQEDHYFFMYPSVDEDNGDSIVIRSNFFFLNLAPSETKALSLKITANEVLDVWMTVPNDTVWPIITNNRYSVAQYCCAKELYACRIGIACNAIDYIGLITGCFPDTPADIIANIASCACNAVSLTNTLLGAILCDGHPNDGFWRKVHDINVNSIVGAATTCFKKFIPGAKMKDLADIIGKMKTAIGAGVIDTTVDCVDAANEAKKKRPGCPGGGSDGGGSTPVNSLDPNDIRGYLSESGSHYMRQEIQNVHYEIEFENDTTLATAAAHTIIVRDTLDASKFDLNSLAARSVTIGDKRLELNGEQTFAKTLDMRPELYVIAQINQDYDPETGIVEWTIQSLDPMTMEPTDDPNQGVLPVNYYGDGVGFIDYSVNLLQAFEDGTEISNRAGIIFDQEDVIMTPTWTNMVDAIKPTSQMVEVIPENDSLNFSFVSEDNRSGVWYHTLYHRNDSTAHEWQVKKAQVFGNSFKLPIDYLQNTEYLIKAVDSAGNVEEKNMVAEYVYVADSIGSITQSTAFRTGWNWWSSYVDLSDINGLTLLEEGLGSAGVQIKSQSKFVINYGTTWLGGLNAINNEQTLKVQVNAPVTVDLTGRALSPADHPITLNAGWNWIGYPCSNSMSLTQAFANYTPYNGDQVKTQSSYAIYRTGIGWLGALQTLNPGNGLFFYTSTGGTLVFPEGNRNTKVRQAENRTAEGNHWVPDMNAYPGNMTVTAIVELEDVELQNERYELAAFANGEVRGSARLMYVEPMNRYMAFLTVAGDEAAELHFGLYDIETGTECFESDDFLVYSADAIVGELESPVTVRFRSTTGLSDLEHRLLVYPNPVKRGERFALTLPVGTKVQVEVVNALGVVVETLRATSVQAPASPGVYTLRITVDGKETYNRKLVVQ